MMCKKRKSKSISKNKKKNKDNFMPHERAKYYFGEIERLSRSFEILFKQNLGQGRYILHYYTTYFNTFAIMQRRNNNQEGFSFSFKMHRNFLLFFLMRIIFSCFSNANIFFFIFTRYFMYRKLFFSSKLELFLNFLIDHPLSLNF